MVPEISFFVNPDGSVRRNDNKEPAKEKGRMPFASVENKRQEEWGAKENTWDHFFLTFE